MKSLLFPRNAPAGSACPSKADTTEPKISDAELLQRMRVDAASTLPVLMERFGNLVGILLSRCTLSHTAVQDVTQDIWLTVLNKWHTYDASKGSLTSWLVFVVRNKAVDHVRRALSYQRTMERAERDQLAKEERGHGVAAPDVEAQDLRNHLRTVMATLPAAQSRVLHLCFFEGLTQREAATRIGIPLGTTKTQYQLAMQKMRTTITPARAAELLAA